LCTNSNHGNFKPDWLLFIRILAITFANPNSSKAYSFAIEDPALSKPNIQQNFKKNYQVNLFA